MFRDDFCKAADTVRRLTMMLSEESRFTQLLKQKGVHENEKGRKFCYVHSIKSKKHKKSKGQKTRYMYVWVNNMSGRDDGEKARHIDMYSTT